MRYKDPGIKCSHCPGFVTCDWRDPFDDTCWFEPNDYESDIGSATVEEMYLQNE